MSNGAPRDWREQLWTVSCCHLWSTQHMQRERNVIGACTRQLTSGNLAGQHFARAHVTLPQSVDASSPCYQIERLIASLAFSGIAPLWFPSNVVVVAASAIATAS